MDALRYAFRISRFRFGIYTAGTYVAGYALGSAALGSFMDPAFLLYLLYFFFPANVFIYGVNDLWDEETDKLNPKKGTKEEMITSSKRKTLLRIVLLSAAISLGLMALQDWTARAIFSGFLLLSYFYSAEPLRFKSKPILDFASNMLYIMPGIFGFYIASGSLPSYLLVLAGFFHISAMQIFSAVPDIECDMKAKITTTAVFFGRKISLALCVAFWSGLSAIALYLSGLHPLSFLALIYPAIPAFLLFSRTDINRIYWRMPYVNTALGGLLTAMVVFSIL